MPLYLPIGLIVVGLVGSYLGSLRVPFLFDDHSAILENSSIRSFADAWWPPANLPVSGRPLVSLSLALNYAIGKCEVFGYHVFNLALHVANGLLVFGIVRRTLGGGSRSRRTDLAALAVALVWGTHPLISETVVYVVQRTELMVSFFMLLASYCAIRGFVEPPARRWHVAAISAGACAVLSKELAVVLPLIVLLYDRTFVSGSFAAAGRRHRLLHAGLFATWLPMIGILLMAPRGQSVGWGLGVTSFDYLITQSEVLVWYLRGCFDPSGLSIAHDWPIRTELAAVWPYLLGVGAILVATLIAVGRNTRTGFCLVVFFLILAPTSSFVPIVSEVAAERRMYLPLLCVVAPLICGMRALLRDLLFSCVAFLALVVLSAMTSQRVGDYQTEVSIWEDAVAKNPSGATALNNVGRAYEKAGRRDDARRSYERAIAQGTKDPNPHLNLGVLLAKSGDFTGAERALLRAAELDPNSAKPIVNLGNVASVQRDWPVAIARYREALDKERRSISAHVGLANALEQTGRLVDAERHLREAASLYPDDAARHSDLALFFARQEKWGDAIASFQEAVRLEPKNPKHQQNLAAARRMNNRTRRVR